MNAGEVRLRLNAVFGQVSPAWESLLELDPEFADAFSSYVDATYSAEVLEPRIRELLLLAHDATVTVLDRDGVRLRVRRARDAGASQREVLDVLEVLTLISIHSLTTGLPMVFDSDEYPQPEQTRGGYWDVFEAHSPGFHGMMAKAMPRAFDAYRELGRVLWRAGGLEPKERELVLIVADLSTSHLFREGAALHIASALHYGATREEVVAAIGLAVPWATRTIELGMDALNHYEEEGPSRGDDRERPAAAST